MGGRRGRQAVLWASREYQTADWSADGAGGADFGVAGILGASATSGAELLEEGRTMPGTGDALRRTSDALLRDLEALVSLEEEKRGVEPGDPRLVDLAAQIESSRSGSSSRARASGTDRADQRASPRPAHRPLRTRRSTRHAAVDGGDPGGLARGGAPARGSASRAPRRHARPSSSSTSSGRSTGAPTTRRPAGAT